MIFQETYAAVLAGTKTQTRRAWRESDAWLIDGDTMETFCVSEGEGGRERWFVGKTYAVQPGRGKHAVGRIRITAIRYCERGAYVNEEDARAEGFATPQDFYLAYLKINGPKATARPAWALTFALVRDAGAPGAGG